MVTTMPNIGMSHKQDLHKGKFRIQIIYKATELKATIVAKQSRSSPTTQHKSTNPTIVCTHMIILFSTRCIVCQPSMTGNAHVSVPYSCNLGNDALKDLRRP
jgi:hypothetical protein